MDKENRDHGEISEQSPNAAEDRRLRREKKPDMQLYRPPPATQKDRGADGDGSSPSSPPRREKDSRQQKARSDFTPVKQRQDGIPQNSGKKQPSNQRRATTGDQNSTNVQGRFAEPETDHPGSRRRIFRGQGSNGHADATERSSVNKVGGVASAKRDRFAREQSGKGGSFEQRQQQKQHRFGFGQSSLETTSPPSSNNGNKPKQQGTPVTGAEPTYPAERKPKEYSRTGSDAREADNWRQFANEGRSKARFNKKPLQRAVTLPSQGTSSMDDRRTIDAPAMQVAGPSGSNRADLERKNGSGIRAAELESEGEQNTSISWADIVDEEEAAAKISLNSFNVGTGGPKMEHTAATQSQEAPSGPRHTGGLIPLTPAVARAINKNENRGRRQGGQNRRGARAAPPYQQFPNTNSFPIGRRADEEIPSIRLDGAGGAGQYSGIGLPTNMQIVRPHAPSQMPLQRREIPIQIPMSNLGREIDELEQRVVDVVQKFSESTAADRKRHLEQLLHFRQLLQGVFADVIRTDPRRDQQRQANEQRMWKNAFYKPIEALRSALHQSATDVDSRFFTENLLALIDEGVKFYENLIAQHENSSGLKIEQQYLPIDDKLEKIFLPPPAVSDNEKHSLACCVRYLVCLGDLARYREQIKETKNYAIARRCYLKASQLMPSNGRAHNQLALLAVNVSRYLDAIYYFIRSLAARIPFETARESLKGLFEDVRLKVKHYENCRERELDQIMSARRAREMRNAGQRLNQRERWKFPKGDVKVEKSDQQEVDEVALLTNVTSNELYKRCSNYILHAVGILFTKIGTENFSSVAALALTQLRALLNLDESPLTASQLVQITLISLFLIHHTSREKTEYGFLKAVQNYAITFSFSIFALLLERLEPFLHDEVNLASTKGEVHILLPAIRIFCTWMTVKEAYDTYVECQSNGGELEFMCQHKMTTIRFFVDLWSNVAKICTILDAYKGSGKLKVVGPEAPRDFAEGILPEDLLTTSFFNIFISKAAPSKLVVELPMEVAAEHVRLHWILQLASVLDGFGLNMLSINEGKYASYSSDGPGAGKIRDAASDEEEESVENVPDAAGPSGYSGEITQLQQLERDREAKQSLLEQEGQRSAEIIVEPNRLVVDTNTFIDHRTLVEKVITSKQYKIMVPFVVFNELLGLTKKDEIWVSQQANASIRMLDEVTKSSQFAKYVKAMTSGGAAFDDFEYHKNEAAGERMQNDDKILKCCRALSDHGQSDLESRQERRDLKYEPITIHREVVLITDDKNLRLKARGDEIPVIGIQEFVKMAKLRTK